MYLVNTYHHRYGLGHYARNIRNKVKFCDDNAKDEGRKVSSERYNFPFLSFRILSRCFFLQWEKEAMIQGGIQGGELKFSGRRQKEF